MSELRKETARTDRERERDVEAQTQAPGGSKSARRLSTESETWAPGPSHLLDLQIGKVIRGWPCGPEEGLHFEGYNVAAIGRRRVT